MRQTQLQSAGAYLILEQLAQRLYQGEVQILRKPSHIVVGFYYLGCLGSALHDVRVNGSLGQELDSLQLSGLLLKHADEFSADNLTLLFRISHSGQLSEETIYSIHIYQVCIHLVFEYINNTLGFPFSHKTMVYMDAGQLFSNGFDEQGRYHGAVHAAG